MQFAILAVFAGALLQTSALDVALSPTSTIPTFGSLEIVPVAAPRILLIDRAKLTAAGLLANPKQLSGMEEALLNEEMQKHDANLLLDRSVVLSGGDDLDITDEVIKDVGPDRGSSSSSASSASAPTDPIRILVFDQTAIPTSPDGDVGKLTTRKLQRLLDKVAREHAANFVVARSAVVLGMNDIDITPIVQKLVGDGSRAKLLQTPTSDAKTLAPDARIMVIDRNAILSGSKVGQSIIAQVGDDTKAVEAELGGESNALRARGVELGQERAAHPSDEVTEKIKLYEQDRTAFKQKVQARQTQIRQGVERARSQIEQILGPILRDAMVRHGANLLLDRSITPKTSAEFDLTAEAISLLDAELLTVPVYLTPSVQ